MAIHSMVLPCKYLGTHQELPKPILHKPLLSTTHTVSSCINGSWLTS